jgi:hypothetical protein
MLRINHESENFIAALGVPCNEVQYVRRTFLRTVNQYLIKKEGNVRWSELAEEVTEKLTSNHSTSLEMIFIAGEMIGEFRYAIENDSQLAAISLFKELATLENLLG